MYKLVHLVHKTVITLIWSNENVCYQNENDAVITLFDFKPWLHTYFHYISVLECVNQTLQLIGLKPILCYIKKFFFISSRSTVHSPSSWYWVLSSHHYRFILPCIIPVYRGIQTLSLNLCVRIQIYHW
jgi:hypothetical protein